MILNILILGRKPNYKGRSRQFHSGEDIERQMKDDSWRVRLLNILLKIDIIRYFLCRQFER